MSNQHLLTNELIELDKKHFIHPTSSIKEQQENGPAVILKEGHGVYVTDINGKTYIEGMASLWNVNVGYGRKELAQAAKEQMEQLAFSSCFATFSNEPAIRLAAKLAEITPGDLSAVFFTSGGSESNDTAYKLVRHYWKLKGYPNKTKIISRKKAYHGVAIGATSATGIQDFQNMTTALAPEFIHADTFSADSVREIIEREGAENIAAFLAEPIQGAGGVNIPPDGYFQAIRKICDENNILFIADEVITGFGRTGKMFACEHWNVVPDVMLIAKGITSGYIPLGAVVLREKLHRDLIQLSEGTLLHGFTYSGHPTACAVALRNIQIIEEENLVENARLMGEELHKQLKMLQSELPIVGEVRSLGLIGALEIVKNKQTNERFEKKLAPMIIHEARQRGLILRTVTFGDADTIVFSPPLVINKQEIEKMFQILRDSIIAVMNDE
ncbi:aspartate aminotransferase family protein [Parageobacillus thermoglucosidasius]|uniref:aminotransferase family protein n=1 Tax=Parageobacillus thermoglucosidasius TaxID=1426 RepID=UPI000B552255|nr:aspartate aminotransferase family protein [Parageobacillus thermoglucosidasius]MBY6269425.1 aspartate aminotransferase family protein [Parageobacillus thermoglucosidasius]MED4905358.1 aspartate aminotransferase family protein [Parageobacillus thermoglucosidasius]MED4913569.1 aspartate aminotransferase family protein [Parageobacillus thermoglucosidasius]MED4944024.1 aspartate aminotransferase family protein [Parageobacillus thermoglucosidasius]MED4984431.1 aspartate aminotransferase family p